MLLCHGMQQTEFQVTATMRWAIMTWDRPPLQNESKENDESRQHLDNLSDDRPAKLNPLTGWLTARLSLNLKSKFDLHHVRTMMNVLDESRNKRRNKYFKLCMIASMINCINVNNEIKRNKIKIKKGWCHSCQTIKYTSLKVSDFCLLMKGNE